jgi:hypothetical protein
LEQGTFVEVERAAEQLAVGKDLRRAGVLLGRHVAGFLEHRQVDVRLDVAHAARVPIPVPRPTEVSRLLDDVEVGDAQLGEVDRAEHAAEATADDDGVGFLDHRLAGETGLNVWVAIEVLVFAGEWLILRVAIGAEPLLALDAVSLASLLERQRPLLTRHRCDPFVRNATTHVRSVEG